jgi:hypothetical protein
MDPMNQRTDRSTLAGFAGAIRNGVSAIARVGLALAAALLMVGAILIGMLLGLGVLVFALLRGRRPQGPVFVWQRRAASARRGPAEPGGEVVDIEAREVSAPPR